MTHTPGPWKVQVVPVAVGLEHTGYAHQRAKSLESVLMDAADELAKEPEATIDDRAWQHLLIYAPKHVLLTAAVLKGGE